jgi:hypothetical protein
MVLTTLRPILNAQIEADTMLMTDKAVVYRTIGQDFRHHLTVEHGVGEYVRGGVHTNTIEGYFSVFKRGITGTYHHVSTAANGGCRSGLPFYIPTARSCGPPSRRFSAWRLSNAVRNMIPSWPRPWR